MVKAIKIDFSKVKGGGQFSKRKLPEGDYLARITKVEDAESSADGEDMWLFTIKLEDKARASYPYYCKLSKNQFWKIRNLIESAGITVPEKLAKVNPEKLLNRLVGVSLQDAEYEGREQSEIAAVFSTDELPSSKKSKKARDDDDDEEEGDEEETEDGDEEEEEEEETSSDDDDEGEDEEDEDDEEAKKKAKRERAKKRREERKKKAGKSTSKKKKDEDEEDEEEDDEMEELEIEDL